MAMNQKTVAQWHEVVRTGEARRLVDLLAEDVVFHSPVVHTAQRGKAITAHYLTAALHVFGNDSFRYVREVCGSRDAILEFQVTLDGIEVNGVDMLHWDDDGRIDQFKVMLRPLKAVNLIHEKMAAMLQAGRPGR